jgi:hypothetical protein
MGLQKYIIFSTFYILSIFALIYYKTQSMYQFDILSFHINLYIAIWVILPLILLFILSIIHILFYGFKGYIKNKNDKKDIEKLEKYLSAIILSKTCNEVFTNKNIRDIAHFLDYLKFDYNSDKKYKTNIDSLDEPLIAIRDIKEGKYIDKLDRTFSIEKTNSLYIENIFNKFSDDNKFYLEVLKNQKDYNKDIIEYAFLTAINNENFSIIKNEIKDIPLSYQAIVGLFRLFEINDNTLTQDDYLFILKKGDLSKEQYIELVRVLKECIQPNELIVFFDKVCDKYENAIKAYIYLLLDLEIIDKAKELLESVDAKDGEYDKFMIYLSVKNSGTKCKISDFV